MEDSLGVGLLALAALVMGIVALAKLSHLGASIEELKRRLSKLEGRDETPAPEPIATKSPVPPPLPSYVTQQPKVKTTTAAIPGSVPARPHQAFNWESILGVKLFAWIGGFAFFLGIVFFVKYAFDNNWITPAMRIVAGAIIGTLLIVVSLLPKVRRYHIPTQSVCATGILILYADVYSAHAFYGLISLTAASGLMWILTAVAVVLANYIAAQSIAWLALIGGFATPFLFWSPYENAWVIFGYIVVIDCAVAAVAALKRWTYLILLAAIGSVIVELSWSSQIWSSHVITTALFNTQIIPGPNWSMHFGTELLFLLICVSLRRSKLNDAWTIAAVAVTGALAMWTANASVELSEWVPAHWCWEILKLPIAVATLLSVAAVQGGDDRRPKAVCVAAGVTLGLASLAEWMVCQSIFGEFDVKFPCGVAVWHTGIFLLFALVPYVYNTERLWPWLLSAISGPLHFLFVHWWLIDRTKSAMGFSIPYEGCIPHAWLWLPTLAFGIPAAIGVWYLLKKEHVDLASGDSRLASQGAAVLTFISLVFPVQFHREWVTLGWAIEGLALILLFHWIPNRRLRVVALIVLAGAFVRLALNPAVLEYHKRTQTPIWNWYLYGYGIAAICFFLSAHWFGEPKEKWYERKGSAFLYSMSGIVLFLLMNIEIADYFSIGPTLTFSFSGNFARDMTYTIAWSLFAFGLLVFGIRKSVRAVRLIGIALSLVAFAKLFLHDLDSLEQLYRIGAFITVAVIAIVASFVYQRFLLPRTKT